MSEVHNVEAAVEAGHWWFVGRRRLFAAVIAGLDLDTAAPVLDIGCGTGAQLRMLRDLGFTDVTGVDFSDAAIDHCRAKGWGPVQKADATGLPFTADAFDLVLATDVIEHLDDDAAALAEVCRVLRPGAHVLVTVPAFASLWGPHDDSVGHKRRYRGSDLLRRVAAAGLEPQRWFHFNFLLFAPIWAARRLLAVLRPSLVSDNEINGRWLNAGLKALFAVDVALAPRLRPPFGVSFLLLARKVPR